MTVRKQWGGEMGRRVLGRREERGERRGRCLGKEGMEEEEQKGEEKRYFDKGEETEERKELEE